MPSEAYNVSSWQCWEPGSSRNKGRSRFTRSEAEELSIINEHYFVGDRLPNYCCFV